MTASPVHRTTHRQPVRSRTRRARADRENGVILSGKFGSGTVAYLGTDRDLGVVLEIFSGTQEVSE
jgi:hypothetical protein